MARQGWSVLPETVAVDELADVNVTINKVKWVMKTGAVVVEKTKNLN